jgi:hypothetical protein
MVALQVDTLYREIARRKHLKRPERVAQEQRQ